MNKHLSVVSTLLLLFYMGWFMWEQNQVIKKQNQEINQLKQQILIQNIFMGITQKESINYQ